MCGQIKSKLFQETIFIFKQISAHKYANVTKMLCIEYANICEKYVKLILKKIYVCKLIYIFIALYLLIKKKCFITFDKFQGELFRKRLLYNVIQ